MADLHLYSDENLVAQLESAPFELGAYVLHFYTEGGTLASRPTDTLEPFYLSPSGGTLRDASFNIVWYDSRFDIYRGFTPPHLRRQQEGHGP